MAGIDEIFSKKFDELTKDIENSFLEEPGPGALPESRNNDNSIKGILVPSADYEISGFSMAWAYKRIAETRFKDVYIILGHCKGNSSIIINDIKTPLGIIKTDRNLANKIIDDTGISAKENQEISDSILFQAPFLQFASKDKFSQLKIIGLEIGNNISKEQLKVLAHFIRKSLKDQNKNCTVIASTNLTEFGNKFGYKPFLYNVEESIENIDYHIINSLEKQDWEDIISFVTKEKANIPGYMALALLVFILGNYETKLLQYYKSDYINKNKDNTQSFLSMEFI